MANIVIFNESTGQVLEYRLNQNESDYTGRTDVVVDPNVSAFSNLPLRYWKVVAGVVQLMTLAEQAEVDAVFLRANAKVNLSGKSDLGVILRAFSDITKDEINILRQWIVSFKVEAAAATNLSNFQSRIASLPNLPDRTLAQLKTAIENRIDVGAVDE